MAGTYNFSIKPGTVLSRPIIWNDASGEPVDITGYSARLVARVRPSDVLPVLDLTDADALTLGTTDGTITINLTAVETLALKDLFRYATYDLYLNDTSVLKGEITIERTNISE